MTPTPAPISQITLGVLTFTAGSGTILQTGPDSYRLSPGVRINGVLELFGLFGTATISGNTLSGTLAIRTTDGYTLASGAFTADVNTGLLTVTSPQDSTVRLGSNRFGICSMAIGPNSVSTSGWIELTDTTGSWALRFTDLIFSPGTAPLLTQFTLQQNSDRCAGASAQIPMVADGIVISETGITFTNARAQNGGNYQSLQFSTFRTSGNALTANGAITVQNFPFNFSRVDIFPGHLALTSSDTIGNVDLSYNGLRLESRNAVVLDSVSFNAPSLAIPNVPVNLPLNRRLNLINMPVTTTSGSTVAFDLITVVASGNSKSLEMPTGININTIDFTFPNDPPVFASDGFRADTIRVDTSFPIVDLAGLRVTNSNVFFGGGGFDLLGLAFNFSVTDNPDDDGLIFDGGLAIPEPLAADFLLAAQVTVTPGPDGPQVQLNELSFCSPNDPSANHAKVKKSKFEIPSICFNYLMGPPEEFGGSLTIAIPQVLVIEGTLAFVGGLLDQIGIEGRELNIPIGNTGVVLQSIAASMDNLSREARKWDQTVRIENPGPPPPLFFTRQDRVFSVPPVTVAGSIGVSAGPKVLDLRLLSATADALLDETQFRLSGTVKVLIATVGNSYFHALWSGPYTGVSVGGFFTYSLIIRGTIEAFLSSDVFVGYGTVGLVVPEGLPFAGQSFAGITAFVRYPPFLIGACILNEALCLQIDETGEVSLNQLQNSRYERWETPFYEPFLLERRRLESGKEIPVYMHMFTNFRQGEKQYRRDAIVGNVKQGAAFPLDLPDGQTAIVRLTYENSAGDPSMNLVTPSGDVYTPAMTLDTVDPNNAPAIYYTSTPRREVGYLIQVSEAGDYLAQVLNPDSLGEYSVELLVSNEAPSIQIQDVAIDGTNLSFQWTDEDADDDARIMIGLDLDRFSINGPIILDGISEDDETDMASVDLANNPIPSGFYWPFAIIEDGANGLVFNYADAPIFVPDPDSSAPIAELQVGGANGTASVTFEPIGDPDIFSYKLSWTDEEGRWSLHNATAIPDGETAALVTGLQNGVPYTFVLAAMSFLDSSEATRAANLGLLDEARQALSARGDLGDWKDAETFLTGVAKARNLTVDPADLRALAYQASEVAKYNRIWEKKGRDASFSRYLDSLRARSLQKVRNQTTEPRYSDSYFLVADNVVLQSTLPQGNAPVFAEEPLGSVVKGTQYSSMLMATDVEGDPITYGLISGPEGFTVSEAGLATWDVPTTPTGPRDVVVFASDGTNTTELAYTVEVADALSGEPPQFTIISRPVRDILSRDTWSYEPVTANASEDAEPFWRIIDGPAGMTIDPTTGAMAWDPSGETLPPSGLLSYRVIITVQEGGTQNRLAIQDFTLNVENQLDAYEALLEQDLPFWQVF